MTKIDNTAVRQLAEVLDETGLTEIEYELNGLRIRVARTAGETVIAASHQAPQPQRPPAPSDSTPTPSSDTKENSNAITAPMVGVVYLLPEPDAPPFVSVGDEVKAGQTIALIEAMKTYNPVKATKAGKVTKIVVESGSPVEFGEPLMVIE